MACPGSVALSAGIPKTSSKYADEGTAAHELAQHCLEKGLDPLSFAEQDWGGFYVDQQDFAEPVKVYVDYIRGLALNCDGGFWIERQFSLDPLNPPAEMGGTADFVGIAGDTLQVADLKFGKGVPVEVEQNKQGLYYALGALISLDEERADRISRVNITIVQPRARHNDGPIRSWSLGKDELIDFVLDLFTAAELTQKPDAPLVTGPQCRWCPAHGACPEARRSALAVAQQEFGILHEEPRTPPAPSSLTPAQIGALMYRFEEVESWMKAVVGHAQALLESGQTVPGWKLVEKVARRKWADDVKAIEWAQKAGVAPKVTHFEILSPAQTEKALGKKFPIPPELISKVSSGVTIAEESDKRPAVKATLAQDEFDLLPQTPEPENKEKP